MTILHVSPYYPPAWAFGSTPGAVASLARAQAAHGHTVIVLTTDAMAPHERLNAGDAVVDGVRVVRVRNLSGATRTWLGCSTPMGLRHAARRLADRVDLVHLHELVTVENLRVVPAIGAQVPVVLSLHGQLMDASRLPTVVTRAWRLLGGHRLGNRINCVTASTPEEADHAHEAASSLCPRLRNTVVMPDGIDAGLPDDAGSGPAKSGPPHTAASGPPHPAASLDTRPGLAEATPSHAAAGDLWGAGFSRHQAAGHDDASVWLVDGRTESEDAVAAIIRAVADLRTEVRALRLIVTGPETAAVRAARDAARTHGLESRVQFSGYLPESRLRQWLDSATLLLLPRGHTGPQTLIVDALARGVAVLAPDTRATIESPALMRPIDTDSGWARAITSMLDTDSVAQRQAAATSVEPLLWPSVARRWLTLYEDLRRAHGARDRRPGR